MANLPLTRNPGRAQDIPDRVPAARVPAGEVGSQEEIEELRAELLKARQTGRTTKPPDISNLSKEFTRTLEDLRAIFEAVGNVQTEKAKNATRFGPRGPLKSNQIQIGLVRTTVPPENIVVGEMPQNLEVPGLRTDGSTIIKTGKGRIQIVLDLVFEGENAINNELRPLIAQFRSYPYVPVISEYLVKVVQPKVQRTRDDKIIQRLNEQVTQATRDVLAAKEDILRKIDMLTAKDLRLGLELQSDAAFVAAKAAFLTAENSLVEVTNTFQAIVDALGGVTRQIQNRQRLPSAAREFLSELGRVTSNSLVQMKGKILQLEQLRHARVQAEVAGAINFTEKVVPCCLDQLQIFTVPKRPNMLRARVVLIFFNAGPYGSVLAYQDLLGRPTFKAEEAIFMRSYLDLGWLRDPGPLPPLPGMSSQGEGKNSTPTNVGTKASGHKDDFRFIKLEGLSEFGSSKALAKSQMHLAYATVDFDQEDLAEVTKKLEGFERIDDILGRHQPKWRTLNIGSNASTDLKTGTVITAISGSLVNRLALQPVQGDVYPSAQYMGAKPAYINMTILTTDEAFVQAFHHMKAQNQRLSVLGTRHLRRTEVHIRNPVLNLMGVFKAQIDDITTKTVTPNTTQIDVRFVEHRIDLQEREQITQARFFSKDKFIRGLSFLFKHAGNYIKNLAEEKRIAQSKVPGSVIVGNYRDLLNKNERVLKAYQQTAYSILFPGPLNIGDVPILTRNIIKRALFLDPLKDTQQGANSRLRAKTRRAIIGRHLDSFARTLTRLRTEDPEVNEDVQELQKTFPPTTARSDAGFDAEFRRRTITQAAVAFSDPTLFQEDSDKYKRETAVGLYSDTFVDQLAEAILKDYTSAKVPPDETELNLLAFYLYRSAGNISDEFNVRKPKEDGDTVRFTRKDGLDKTDEIRSVIRFSQAVLQDEVAVPNEAGLRRIVLGNQSLDDFLRKTSTKVQSTLYPDLKLPTYGQMLADVLKELQRLRGAGAAPITSLRDPDNPLKQKEKEYLAKFVPTYRSIGQIPELPRLILEDFAYDLDDNVMPDFPYFARFLPETLTDAELQADERMRGSEGSLKPKRIKVGDREHIVPGGQSGNNEETSKGLIDPLRQLEIQRLFDAEEGKATDEAINQFLDRSEKVKELGTKVNTEILETTLYSPGIHRMELEDLGATTADTLHRISAAASASQEDNRMRLQRCFPTFRVFFIEDDTKEGIWRAIDDVYSYNSVVSLTITRHKYQPDLAEIHLTNLEGNLEYDKFNFSTARSGGEAQINAQGEEVRKDKGATEVGGPKEPGTNERTLTKFPLSEGTRIAVQLGYQSKPGYMETVFTGKIAEVQMGDMVKIVAQSYLQELLYPMTQNPNTEKPRGVIEEVMGSDTVEHFGRWTPLSFQRLSKVEKQNAKAHNWPSAISDRFATIFIDPKMRNVFTAHYGSWWGEFFNRLFAQEKWEVGGGTKTGWDVIQDVIKYTPGYIAAVVPYDLEATLFVGRPEQPYFWTDGFRDLEQAWTQSRRKKAKKREEAVATTVRRFLNSDDFDGGVKRLAEYIPPFDYGSWNPQNLSGNIIFSQDQKAARAKQKRAFLALAAKHPKWTQYIDRMSTWIDDSDRLAYGEKGDGQKNDDWNQRDVSRLLSPSYVDDSIGALGSGGAIPGPTPLAAAAAEKQKLQDGFTAAVGRSVARDFSYIHDLLGGDEEARIRALDMLGRVIQGLGIRTGGAQTTLRFQLPNMVDPWTLFEIIYGRGESVTYERVLAAVNQVTYLEQPDDFEKRHIASAISLFSTTIPVLVRAFRNYLSSDPLFVTTNNTLAARITSNWPMNPRTRPFRRYHRVSTYDDLIDNQMVATRGAMWNGVAISSGGGRPLILWADEGIVKGDRSLKYFRESNADLDMWNHTVENGTHGFTNNFIYAGYTRLAQGLRFMYRGQLVLRGRPTIKPWDIIHMHDAYNFMVGPVEVERVTHHFNQHQGFTTTITPHAVVIPNNQVDSAAVMAEGWKAGTEMLGFVAAAGVIGGIIALPFGLAAGLAIGIGAAAGTKVIGDEILRVTSGTDIIGNLVGVGRYGGMRTPVKIFPLMRMGAPWTASLRGFGRGTKDPYGFIWEGLQRGRNQVKDAKEAAAFLWDEFWAARGFEAETAFGTGSLEEVARNLEAKAKASARTRSR